MKTSKKVSFTLLSTFMLISYSQTLYSQDIEIDFDRWEIGVDLLPLINKNVVPISFFIKKLNLKQKKFAYIRQGYRLRIGAEITNSNTSPLYDVKSTEVLIRPGFEWDKKIKSTEIFYGIDIVSRYQRSLTEGILDGLNQAKLESSSLYLGVSPIIGVNYKIVKNIKASVESSIDILYRQNKQAFFQADTNTENEKSKGFYLKTNPIFTVNMVFVF